MRPKRKKSFNDSSFRLALFGLNRGQVSVRLNWILCDRIGHSWAVFHFSVWQYSQRLFDRNWERNSYHHIRIKLNSSKSFSVNILCLFFALDKYVYLIMVRWLTCMPCHVFTIFFFFFNSLSLLLSQQKRPKHSLQFARAIEISPSLSSS